MPVSHAIPAKPPPASTNARFVVTAAILPVSPKVVGTRLPLSRHFKFRIPRRINGNGWILEIPNGCYR
jgi:hypothetical protein